MTTEERRRRRFTESFRKEQVAKIDSGELTITDVCRLYEVSHQRLLNPKERSSAQSCCPRISPKTQQLSAGEVSAKA